MANSAVCSLLQESVSAHGSPPSTGPVGVGAGLAVAVGGALLAVGVARDAAPSSSPQPASTSSAATSSRALRLQRRTGARRRPAFIPSVWCNIVLLLVPSCATVIARAARSRARRRPCRRWGSCSRVSRTYRLSSMRRPSWRRRHRRRCSPRLDCHRRRRPSRRRHRRPRRPSCRPDRRSSCSGCRSRWCRRQRSIRCPDPLDRRCRRSRGYGPRRRGHPARRHRSRGYSSHRTGPPRWWRCRSY